MKNGQCWLDDKGNLIQAHGGMITQFNGLSLIHISEPTRP